MIKPNFCTSCTHCLEKFPDSPIMNECALTITNYASPDMHDLCIAHNKDGMCKKFKARDWDGELKKLKGE